MSYYDIIVHHKYAKRAGMARVEQDHIALQTESRILPVSSLIDRYPKFSTLRINVDQDFFQQAAEIIKQPFPFKGTENILAVLVILGDRFDKAVKTLRNCDLDQEAQINGVYYQLKQVERELYQLQRQIQSSTEKIPESVARAERNKRVLARKYEADNGSIDDLKTQVYLQKIEQILAHFDSKNEVTAEAVTDRVRQVTTFQFEEPRAAVQLESAAHVKIIFNLTLHFSDLPLDDGETKDTVSDSIVRIQDENIAAPKRTVRELQMILNEDLDKTHKVQTGLESINDLIAAISLGKTELISVLMSDSYLRIRRVLLAFYKDVVSFSSIYFNHNLLETPLDYINARQTLKLGLHDGVMHKLYGSFYRQRGERTAKAMRSLGESFRQPTIDEQIVEAVELVRVQQQHYKSTDKTPDILKIINSDRASILVRVLGMQSQEMTRDSSFDKIDSEGYIAQDSTELAEVMQVLELDPTIWYMEQHVPLITITHKNKWLALSVISFLTKLNPETRKTFGLPEVLNKEQIEKEWVQEVLFRVADIFFQQQVAIQRFLFENDISHIAEVEGKLVAFSLENKDKIVFNEEDVRFKELLNVLKLFEYAITYSLHGVLQKVDGQSFDDLYEQMQLVALKKYRLRADFGKDVETEKALVFTQMNFNPEAAA